MDLAPGGIIAWLIVGLIAGWAAGALAAGALSRGQGLGIIGDIVVGLIGALVGGFLAGFFIHGSVGLIGSILIAFVGAVILLAIFRGDQRQQGRGLTSPLPHLYGDGYYPERFDLVGSTVCGGPPWRLSPCRRAAGMRASRG